MKLPATIALFILGLITVASPADPVPGRGIQAPQRVEVEVGWPGTVEIANAGKVPTLIVNLFDDKVQFRREFTDDPGVMRFFAFGRVPGEYPIIFVICESGKPVEAGRVVVAVRGPVPVPPPPGPVPPPPAPVVDPLLDVLRPIYGADQNPGKQAVVRQLAAVYKVAATQTVTDPAVTTTKRLAEIMAEAGRIAIGPDALKPLRERIGQETAKVLGEQSVNMDALPRSKAAKHFERVAAVLEVLGK